MRNNAYRNNFANRAASAIGESNPRHLVIGVILAVALFAFELFNFDTTRYALTSLLGDVVFVGLSWASILAIAFCAIDFAGLARLFTPERGKNEPKEVWYLMGAWLLGATMNAVMTWWAVSLTLLNHPLGNEIMARETLLRIVPIFVAVLVWLTRILFIGSLTVAAEQFFDFYGDETAVSKSKKKQKYEQPSASPVTARPSMPSRPAVRRPSPAVSFSPDDEEAAPIGMPQTHAPMGYNAPARQPITEPRSSRVRRRPPMPASARATVPVGMKASPKQQ